MIPDNLLFQMPLISLGFLHLSDLLFAFIGAGVIMGIYLFASQKKNIEKHTTPSLPGIMDDDFELRLSEYLRARITREYAPHHTRAHTVKEIEKYAARHVYLPLLYELEVSVYQTSPLSLLKRKILLSKIKK